MIIQIDLIIQNGQMFTGETRLVRGDYANPIQRDELVEKFDFLTDQSLGRDQCEKFKSMMFHLEDSEDIRSLINILG